MGLVISHGAYSGGYISFGCFRRAIAKAMGGDYPPYEGMNMMLEENWFWTWDEKKFNPKTHPGLFIFMRHSDCSGYIHPNKCKMLADEIEQLLPALEQLEKTEGVRGGHILRDGGYVEVAKRLIKGCREAYAKKERLEFH